MSSWLQNYDLTMSAENTVVGTEHNYIWNACSFKYSILGEKKGLGKASNQNANVELRIEKTSDL